MGGGLNLAVRKSALRFGGVGYFAVENVLKWEDASSLALEGDRTGGECNLDNLGNCRRSCAAKRWRAIFAVKVCHIKLSGLLCVICRHRFAPIRRLRGSV